MRTFLIALALTVPALAAPENKLKANPADGAAEIADKLQERVDLDGIKGEPLRTVIDVLQEKVGYTILLDYKGILTATGAADDAAGRQSLEQAPVTLPALKKVRLETALRQVLDQVNADFLIEPDHIRVTAAAAKDLTVGPRHVLPSLRRIDEAAEEPQTDVPTQIRETRTVTAAFHDIPLTDALRTVSLRTGRAVAINPDAAEKAKVPVSLALANAPFETAVLTLAEAAGLRAFRAGNAAVVVTPERAKHIEEINAPGFIDIGGPGGVDPVAGLRRDLNRADEERKALADKLKALSEELEKLKKK
jgi:hypothetical protein